MLMAMAGVMVAEVLRPAAITRAPSRTPILEVQLYSIAGAKPMASLKPVWSRIARVFCTPGEEGSSLPITRVLLW